MPNDGAISVCRQDGELLVIQDPLALARAFFEREPSANSEAFDQLAGREPRSAIVLSDIIAMNAIMRARSPHGHWTALIEDDNSWLEAIPVELDLLELDDEDWRSARGDEHLRAALAAVLGPGRGLAVATKLLHLKRPRLFPLLDALVGEVLGARPPPPPTSGQSVEVALRLAGAVRREGRQNVDVLRRVQAALRDDGVARSLVRIFDALLWFSHPAAGLAGATRVIQVSLEPPRASADVASRHRPR